MGHRSSDTGHLWSVSFNISTFPSCVITLLSLLSLHRCCVFQGLPSAAQYPQLPVRTGSVDCFDDSLCDFPMWKWCSAAKGAPKWLQSLCAVCSSPVCANLAPSRWGLNPQTLCFFQFFLITLNINVSVPFPLPAPTGSVWVFSVYQPNYDPAAADGLYCNKTLYTFAFWNVVWEIFVIGCQLAKFCGGLMFYVVVRPSPTNRDFYRQVWDKEGAQLYCKWLYVRFKCLPLYTLIVKLCHF